MRSRMTLAMSAVAVGIVAFCSITTEPSRAQINLPQFTLPGITPGLSEQPGPAQAQPAEQAKADNCLARPGGVTPRGRHWFYRMDRQTRRKCWYLGSASEKVRRAPVERTKEDDEASAPTPASPPAELRPDELRQDALRPAEQPMSERTADAAADANPVAAPEFSASWPSLPNGVNANDADVTTATATTATPAAPATATAATPAADDAGDAAALDAQQEEMPLVWPVLTAAERAAAAQTSDAANPGLGQLLTFLAAAAAFVALAFRVIFKLSSRLIRGSERRTPVQPVAPVIRPRPPARSVAKPAPPETSIEAMAEPTIARLREIAKRWETPTRVPRQPRMPAYELVPDYKVEMTTPRRRQAVA